MRRDQHPEPFWRAARNCYYLQLGRTQIKLHPDRDEAYRLYHERMSRPPEPEQPRGPANPIPAGLVVELLDTFLDWVKKNKTPRTYAWYSENIQRFVDRIAADLTIVDLKPFHVTTAMDDFPHWNNNSRYNFISSIQRAFNWALEQEIIDRSPVARMKKPAREARESALSPAEYAEVIAAVTSPQFRDLLEVAWETGARPQELPKLEARFLEDEATRIVFPPKHAKGKKYHRVIYLTEKARTILARLAGIYRKGPLLRNAEGNAWNKESINCAFCRLQLTLGRQEMKRLGLGKPRPARLQTKGIDPEKLEEATKKHRSKVKKWQTVEQKLAREHGKKYHIGAFRKGYATEALKAGVDTVTVSHLLGHRDPSMVSKIYGLVQQDPVHMAKSARKAKRIRKPASASRAGRGKGVVAEP